MNKIFLCKCDFSKNGRRYHRGHEYKSLKFNNSFESVFILTDDFVEDGHIIKGMWFYCAEPYRIQFPSEYSYCYNYFYTDKELRSIKLKKLYDSIM